MNKICVSIVTHSPELISNCLKSLYQKCDTSELSIFVIQNDCIFPKTYPQLSEYIAKGVTVYINQRQMGFASNHNKIIRENNSDYYLLLNDDLIFTEDTIKKLKQYLDENDDVGVISPKLLNKDGTLQPSTYGFPTLFTVLMLTTGVRSLLKFSKFTNAIIEKIFGEGKSRFWAHDKILDVDTFRGACVLMRGKTIDEVGLMNEDTLFFGEELEWHRRIKESGWRIVFYPLTQIIHLGGTTINQIKQGVIEKEHTKSLLVYFSRHSSSVAYYCLLYTILIKYFLRYLIASDSNCKEILNYHKKLNGIEKY